MKKLIDRAIKKLVKANEEQFGGNKKLDCCDLNKAKKDTSSDNQKDK